MERVYRVLEIAKEAQKKDCDSVFAVVGGERMGKSMFTLHCLDYLGASPESICVDKNNLAETFKKLKKYDCLDFDEAIDGLFSKEGLKKFNKELEKLFMICGQENWITFVLIPDFFMLSPMFRKRRIIGLFHIYRRGRVKFFDRIAIKKINFNHDRYKTPDIKGAKPLFYDTFPKYKGRLLKPYLEMKAAKVEQQKQNFADNVAEPKPHIVKVSKKARAIALLKEGWKPRDIAKELQMDVNYVYTLRKTAVIT